MPGGCATCPVYKVSSPVSTGMTLFSGDHPVPIVHKMRIANAAGLRVVFSVSETREEYDANRTKTAVPILKDEGCAWVVVSDEPV